MIELKVDKFAEGIVIFHIERQDVEDYKRLKSAKKINLDKGGFYYLQSSGYPEILNKTFFVRGTLEEQDKSCIATNVINYLKIFECIKKYNKEFC